MKKIIILTLVMMLIVSMAIPAYAVTPKLDIPNVPQISNIKLDVKLDTNMEKALEDHVAEWVKKIDFSKINLPKFSELGD